MKNNLIVKNITNSWFVILILGIFSLGGILYGTWNYESKNTISAFLLIIETMSYLVTFVLPSFLIFTSIVYKKLNNPIYIMRFETRKKYVKFLFNTSIKSILIIFLYYIIINIICLNIVGVFDYTIQSVSYSTTLFFIITKLIKLLFFLILMHLVAIITLLKFKNSTSAGLFNIGLYIFIFTIKYLPIKLNFFLKALSPRIYLSDVGNHFNSYCSNLLATLLFVSVYSILLLVIINKSIKKIEFLEKE